MSLFQRGKTPVMSEARPPKTGARVLVIDDEAPLREWLQRGLPTRGFQAATVSDGAEALEKSKALGDWTGPGKIYFKVFHDALAPRNFKGSEDQGTITVRYVLQDIAPNRFRIHIDAKLILAKNARRLHHKYRPGTSQRKDAAAGDQRVESSR